MNLLNGIARTKVINTKQSNGTSQWIIEMRLNHSDNTVSKMINMIAMIWQTFSLDWNRSLTLDRNQNILILKHSDSKSLVWLLNSNTFESNRTSQENTESSRTIWEKKNKVFFIAADTEITSTTSDVINFPEWPPSDRFHL